MATPAHLRNPIDHKLWYIRAEVEDLPLIAESWDEMTESDQITCYLEWKELMDRVGCHLAGACRAGQLTPDQQVGYRKLLGKL